jgi:folate-binding protein YgfZ
MSDNLLQENTVFFFTESFAALTIEGKDAESFLQNLISNDIRMLTEQNIIRSIIPNTSGKIAFDVFLKKLAKTSFQVFFCPNDLEPLKKHLEFFHILEELEIKEAKQTTFFYLLFCEAEHIKEYQKPMDTEIIEQSKNYLLLTKKPTKDNFSNQNLQELKTQDFEKTRAFFAIPKKSVDYSEKRLPQEAAFRKLVSFKKGCFVGQEPIARLEHKGRLVRILSQLICKSPLQTEQKITNGRQIIGSLTSCCPHSYQKNYYGLGYLKTQSLLAKEPIYLDKENTLLQAFPLEKIK